MKPITRLNLALQDGLSKEIFDHIRNYLICALILAIGTSEIKGHSSLLFGLIPGNYSGYGVVVFAFILIAFNLYDGIRKLSRTRYHLTFTISLITLYIFMSIRVIEMTWHFRADAIPL